MLFLKQSTAATVMIGPVLDANGGLVTSGLVIGDLRISKNGTVLTPSGNTLTHSDAGHWLLSLTTSNTDTINRLTISMGNASYAMAFRDYTVLLPSVFDALITNATNSTGGLATATGSITALAGAISTLTAPQVRTELATELGRIDVATSTRMATYTQPTGFLAATFPTTVASPTNITQASGVTLAATTHTGATIPTVTSITNGVTVSDKTGFKLASDGLAQVTSWTVAITGNITGNLSGSVGSISGVTFPSNFSSLSIDSNGKVLLQPTQTGVTIPTVTVAQELGSGALAANDLYTPIAQNVWNQLTTSTWLANSFGKTILVSGSTNRVIKVTGSGAGHVAADLHESQANSIHETTFDTNAMSARVLASDAATEIANAVAATQALSRLDSMIESDGAGQFRFDTIALSMAPAGGGGGGTDWTANERTAIRSILGIPTSGTTPTDPTAGILDEIRDDINAIGINVYPVQASTPERVQGTTLTFYRNESRSVSVVTDFTLTSLTLQFTVEDADGVDVYALANGSISRSSQTFTLAVTTAVTGNLGQYRWSMRDISGGGSSVIAMGVLTVQEAASNV
jgi:hypothetical protein